MLLQYCKIVGHLAVLGIVSCQSYHQSQRDLRPLKLHTATSLPVRPQHPLLEKHPLSKKKKKKKPPMLHIGSTPCLDLAETQLKTDLDSLFFSVCLPNSILLMYECLCYCHHVTLSIQACSVLLSHLTLTCVF